MSYRAVVAKKGAAILLPNGERRIDFIRRKYYNEGRTRREIIDMMADMGHHVVYQIVYASTREGARGDQTHIDV